MEEDDINDVNNIKQNLSAQKSINNKNINLQIEPKGIIPGFKDFQTLQIEKILNYNKIPYKKPSLKAIFEKKDILFNNEYISLNSLYSTLYCYVKINKDYNFGKLTILDKNIVVELNKKLVKLKLWSFSDISTENAKNNSSDNQLPNYKLNDTIDKILTGNNNTKDEQLSNYYLHINLDLITCKLIIHKEKQKFRLLLLGYKKSNSNKNLRNTKTIKFNCINAEKNKFYQICEIINKNIILSEGYKINLFGINFRKNYYEYPFISVLNYVKDVNTCDILLFKTNSSQTNCQRCLTKSEYDHIALTIKNRNNLQIYDCIEEHGIRLRNFSEFVFLMQHLCYEKIVYRKLSINIDNMIEYIHKYNLDKYENIDNYNIENISVNEVKNKFYKIINEKLEIFIQKNIDMKYRFSVCKYLCKSKKTKNNQNINRTSYFCSELVASIYMFCNIMSKEYDPFNYLPGDFSDKKKIDFINGFHFEPEMIIDFSDNAE